MNVKKALEYLERTENQISSEIRAKHPAQVHLIEAGIGIILNGITIAGEGIVDPDNIEQFILRRYLYVIPFRANWAFKSLIGGFPSTSYSLLRVLLEELVSMNYFGTFQDAARSALNDENYIEPKFNRKLNRLAKDSPFLKIAATLSDGYVHPALVKPPFTRDSADGEALPEPYYDNKATNFGLDLLVTFLEIAVVIAFAFDIDDPEFHSWRENANLYLRDTGNYGRERISSLTPPPKS